MFSRRCSISILTARRSAAAVAIVHVSRSNIPVILAGSTMRLPGLEYRRAFWPGLPRQHEIRREFEISGGQR
jgi:hypothetical protein